MKRHLKKFVLEIAFFVIPLNTYALIPNTDQPNTFIGPAATLRVTNTITHNTAFSLLGEAGAKNYRAGVTVALKLEANQYLKLSTDYLWQDIAYAFFAGFSNKWTNQASISAAYGYDLLGYHFDPNVGVNAYVSHSSNKSLSTLTGFFTNNSGIHPYTDERHLADSRAGGISPFISIQPWPSARADFELNYDHVSYNRNFSPNKTADGLGGSIRFKQTVFDDSYLALAAAVRKPFNHYAADFVWTHIPYHGMWSMGINAEYTGGKTTLPDTYNIGISLDYYWDNRCESTHHDLADWAAQPAVYLPQVLAISDERVT